MWSDPPALARAVALGALAWLGIASWSCGGDDEDSVIDVVVIEPEPGLPSRLESVRIEVTRLGATSEETRAVTRAARYGERLLEPWTERLRPQRSDDPGHTLYRIVATGLRGGRPYVSSQARLVFVPGSRVVLPLRLEAACVGAACGPDETCRAGACTDDWVASCDLVAGGTPAYCRSPMDAGLARDLGAHDSGPEDAGPSDAGAVDAEPMDAGPMDAGPMDAGPMDAGPVDAGPMDAGPMDTGPMDAGPMDAGPMDAGPMDTGPMDAGPMDTGPMDAGPMDAGPMDAGPMDTGPMDAGPMDT
ncbi:MAG: hypothetical protein IT379_38700, partial [Deltaproteobacteria bacterium]|nr:hypothetical protein [Deltaproteobacteria bacterium]